MKKEITSVLKDYERERRSNPNQIRKYELNLYDFMKLVQARDTESLLQLYEVGFMNGVRYQKAKSVKA